MNNLIKFMSGWLTRIFLSFILVATLLLVGCDDDPEPVNEEEVITTFTVTLTPVGGGSTVTLKFYDADGDGPTTPVFMYTPVASGANAAVLVANKIYNASIELLNETETPAENKTEEIKNEDEDHLFCFEPTSGLVINYTDRDDNGRPIGLTSTWATGAAGNKSVSIILKHQPDGLKDGTCAPGEADIKVTFAVSVQ